MLLRILAACWGGWHSVCSQQLCGCLVVVMATPGYGTCGPDVWGHPEGPEIPWVLLVA